MIPTAKVIDKMNPKYMITFGFLQRAVFNFMYFYMKNPKSKFFYIFSPFYHYGLFFLTVNIYSYLQKKYPKKVRGILMNV